MTDINYHKRNFFNTDIADIYRALDGKSLTGAFTLTFCLIDHLAWLEFGHTSDQKANFCKWIQKRLAPGYIFYEPHAEELYSIRCALVHTYGPSKEMMKKTYDGYQLNAVRTGSHLQKVNNNILKVCLYSLLTDTIYAAHLIFEELNVHKSPDMIERLERQITLGIDPPLLYGNMHAALSEMDLDNEISLHTIRYGYTEKVLLQF